MEFLVEIDIQLPAEMSKETKRALYAEERVRGNELRRLGAIQRIWRLDGRTANVGVWNAPDIETVYEYLAALPLRRWMEIRIQPLALHPLEADQ